MNTTTLTNDALMSKNYVKAKKLTIIPIMTFIITLLCFVLALTLEHPTNRGSIYVLFLFIALLGIFLSPLPCLMISLIGTISAAKASHEGIKQSRKFIILGILEILASFAGIAIGFWLFINGQSV